MKLSQGQKDRLRKKRKKAREYLEKILSSGTTGNSDKSSDESICSTKDVQSSKTNSSDTNLRTKERIKKEKLTNQTDKKSKKVNFSEKVFIKVFEYKRNCERSLMSQVDKLGKPKSCKDWVPIKNGDEFVFLKTKEPSSGDEFDSSKSKEPRSGN